MPRIEQLVLAALGARPDEAERRAYRARKRAERDDRVLRRLALFPHRHLQGALRGRPARRVLRRPARSGAGGSLRHLPPALLDQHGTLLGAGPTVPRCSATTARSTPSRATSTGCVRARAASGPRTTLSVAGRRPGRLGLGDARQRARAARPRAAGTSTHALAMLVPEAWEGEHRARPGGARLLPLPLRPLRAVGRAGGARLHRRSRRRRGARPQRPAAAALRGRRRPRRLRIRGRRGGSARGAGAARQARPGRDDRWSIPARGLEEDTAIKRRLAARAPVRRMARARPRAAAPAARRCRCPRRI